MKCQSLFSESINSSSAEFAHRVKIVKEENVCGNLLYLLFVIITLCTMGKIFSR